MKYVFLVLILFPFFLKAQQPSNDGYLKIGKDFYCNCKTLNDSIGVLDFFIVQNDFNYVDFEFSKYSSFVSQVSWKHQINEPNIITRIQLNKLELDELKNDKVRRISLYYNSRSKSRTIRIKTKAFSSCISQIGILRYEEETL